MRQIVASTVRYVLDCLADDFQLADEGVLTHPIGHERDQCLWLRRPPTVILSQVPFKDFNDDVEM